MVRVMNLLILAVAAQETTLFDFEAPPEPARVAAWDVKVETKGGVLRVRSGHAQEWPGVTLKAPNGVWDLSCHAEVRMDVANAGRNAVTVGLRVDSGSTDGLHDANTTKLTDRTAEHYFRTVRSMVKEVASNQLYLGCRFAWTNPRVVEIAAAAWDVVSFNVYQRPPVAFVFPMKADAPAMITEFHFGATDRGPFHPGLVPARSQAERAALYRDTVRAALRHPQIVGTHWFQYRDQPATGRELDGENYQVGFVDIADTPYPETVSAAREVGFGLYEERNRRK